MIQKVFYNFDELVDFLRYMEPGVNFKYAGLNDPNGSGFLVVVFEISEQDYQSAKEEYEADAYTNYA